MLGTTIASFVVFIPPEIQYIVPYYFRFLAWFVGMIIAFIGIIILWGRCKRVGADHLITPGRPGTVNWFYFYADGEMRILPSKRAGEGQLYNDELDSQIIDAKTYSLCDHKIRIVPEVVGHAVDLDYVLYVNLLETRYGYENLREARQGYLSEKLKRTKEIIDNEEILVGDEELEGGEPNESLSKKVKELSIRPKRKKPTTTT